MPAISASARKQENTFLGNLSWKRNPDAAF
jgi:hypothetical protein